MGTRVRSARGRMAVAMVAAGLVLGTVVGGCEQPPKDTSVWLTGLVDATEVDVASKIPGRILEVLVRDGDTVTKGQKLVLIESDEISAKIAQVEAAINASEAKLALARKGAREEEKEAVKKQVAAARHQVKITRKAYQRMTKLLEEKAIPQSTFDDVEFKYNVSRDQLAVAEAKHAMVQSGARDEEIEALEALVAQAKGALAEVKSYEQEKEQTAPMAGVVTNVVLHAGELAATGYPIITLVDLSDIWVTFAVREDRLRALKVGTEITAEIPAVGTTTTLVVFDIAAMGDFATWKSTSAKDAFDLRTFEVKARPKEPVEGLRPGMTVRWKVAD